MRSSKLLRVFIAVIIVIVLVNAIMIISFYRQSAPSGNKVLTNSTGIKWQPPDTSALPFNSTGNLIRYGRELIANTSYYLGPRGKVAAITNGMNCQNCHLDAGTKAWGNNYSAVFANYPKFRERSGTIENINKRINDCLERSLNGRPLDTVSHEMKAIAAYINWVGSNVTKNTKPPGSGIRSINFLDRAADPVKGQSTYTEYCQRCHGANGQGLSTEDSMSYVYPPLWGKHSYNTGAGLFRLTRLAGYIKDNMPFGMSHLANELTDEQAWDVAAFINSQPRPLKIFKQDWPDIATKPIDHPFGPYKDEFSERQHKYGPYTAMGKK